MANPRYHIRGNGRRVFRPGLTPAAWQTSIHSSSEITAATNGVLLPAQAGRPAEVIYKIEGANVITSLQPGPWFPD